MLQAKARGLRYALCSQGEKICQIHYRHPTNKLKHHGDKIALAVKERHICRLATPTEITLIREEKPYRAPKPVAKVSEVNWKFNLWKCD